MGVDKALIDVGGRTLAQVSLDALHAAGAAEVFLVGGNPEALAPTGERVVADQHPGEGPLGGIVTALAAARHGIVVVLACDHLSTEAPAVRSVVGALGSADVAVPVVAGRMQTMHAAWRRRTLPHLRAVFEGGGRSVLDGLRDLSVVRLLDGDPCWFADADTPADLP